MQNIFLSILLGLAATCSATLSGPYLFWGHEKVIDLQPRALVEATEQDFAYLFREAKAIVVFVRNSTGRLDGKKYPQFQQLVRNNAWAYLPQHVLAADPFNYNSNIEVINLGGSADEEDVELISGFNDAVTIYGPGEVLGILANREEDFHYLSKREDKDGDDDGRPTTPQPATTEETDEGVIYMADGQRALLYVNNTTILNLTKPEKQSLKLVEHQKLITFDDQKARRFGRLAIIFTVDSEKVVLRFNFTIIGDTWSMKEVAVEYKGYKNILPIVGNEYDVPSAPVGFSYRCSSRKMLFVKDQDSLEINDYQVQPWLNGSAKFGDAYDCVGFITTPIWAGILVSLFLCAILSVGLIAILEIKTPNRFESSRNKQLTFTVQE